MKLAFICWAQLLPLIYSVYAAPTDGHLHYDGPMCQINCDGSAPCDDWGARLIVPIKKITDWSKQTGILAHVPTSAMVQIHRGRRRRSVSCDATEVMGDMVAKVSKQL